LEKSPQRVFHDSLLPAAGIPDPCGQLQQLVELCDARVRPTHDRANARRDISPAAGTQVVNPGGSLERVET
jgi:hypothetical protein